MEKKIYVGNLSYSVSDSSLTSLFAQYGQVDSERSKGFAFVEMSSDTKAVTATENLNGTEQDSRSLKVSEATPAPSLGGRSRY